MFSLYFVLIPVGKMLIRSFTIIEKSSGVCGLDAQPGPGKMISHGSRVIENTSVFEREKSCHDYVGILQYKWNASDTISFTDDSNCQVKHHLHEIATE